MPPSVNRSNAKHYSEQTVTEYKEFAGRSHLFLRWALPGLSHIQVLLPTILRVDVRVPSPVVHVARHRARHHQDRRAIPNCKNLGLRQRRPFLPFGIEKDGGQAGNELSHKLSISRTGDPRRTVQ